MKCIVNLGRQFGSGGKEIALCIGKKLDIPVYDNSLLIKFAEMSGFQTELFKQKDEKKGLASLFTDFNSWAFSTFSHNNVMSDSSLFKIQSECIKKIAGETSAVIIGRCADYILRDLDYTLDVFVTSPIDRRIDRVMQRLKFDSADKAEAFINKMDRERAAYYNYYTFGNWGVASNYDLCIDSSILGIEQTSDLVIDVLKRRGLL